MGDGPDEFDLELQDDYYREQHQPPTPTPDPCQDEGVGMETDDTEDTPNVPTEKSTRIRRKDVFLRVKSGDKDRLFSELRALAIERQWEYVMLVSPKGNGTYYIGLHSQKPGQRVDIRTGLKGLEAKLPSATAVWDTSETKNVMTSRKMFAKCAFPMGIGVSDVVGRSDSKYFHPSTLNQYLTPLAEILDSGTRISSLLYNKKIKLSQVGHVQRARKAIEEEENQDSGRPDMEKPITIHYKERDHNGKIVPGGICKSVKVVPRPGEVDAKLKHYYVYSAKANMGKTRSTEEAFAPYSSDTVPDCNNAAGVERDVQWLLLDEYGKTKNKKFEFNQLKAICGGGGLRQGFINIKGYDQSYIPRADVQLFITSNKHIFEVYANNGFVSRSDAETLRARFHIICLDGDEMDDAMRYVDLEEMDDKMYIRTMKNKFYKMLSAVMRIHVTTAQDVSYAITELWTLHKKRFEGQITNTNHFEQYFVHFLEEDDKETVMDIFKAYQCHASFQTPSNYNPHKIVTLKGRRQGLIEDYLIPE